MKNTYELFSAFGRERRARNQSSKSRLNLPGAGERGSGKGAKKAENSPRGQAKWHCQKKKLVINLSNSNFSNHFLNTYIVAKGKYGGLCYTYFFEMCY